MSDSGKQGGRRGVGRIVLSVVVCVMLIGAAAGTSHFIFALEPKAQSEGATRRSAALVETTQVRRGDHRPQLDVLGVVEPARDVVLSPRVTGEIVGMDPAFVPGGLVSEDEPLLQIDQADFIRVLTARESERRQVKAELAIEQGRQLVARQEFELLGEEVEPANQTLVLREPQIESIRARLQAAEAAVEQAQLDLERTTVRAPFDAQILTRSVNLGSQVGPGDQLGRLVGVDEYWVMASVPLRDLKWLQFPEREGAGSPVRVHHPSAWSPGAFRDAELASLIGIVDDETRLARVRVTVADPLGMKTGGPPLILGTIVQLHIEGRPLQDVIRLDREYLRKNDTVWVMVGDELDIRQVDVVYRDAQHAFIIDGLDDGEHVVTTNLATVTNGLQLRRVNVSSSGETETGGADSP